MRSETSLFQIVGRAARNVNGKAILYADKMTQSIQNVIREMERRRKIQQEYNEKHGITPQTVKKELRPLVDPQLISANPVKFEDVESLQEVPDEQIRVAAEGGISYKPNAAMEEVTFETPDAFLAYLQETMLQAARNMEFEEAARMRDQIEKLKKELV